VTINADGYLEHLRSYLKVSSIKGPHYGNLCNGSERKDLEANEFVLADTDEASKERLKVKMSFKGTMLGIRLDACQQPLFHFLDSENTKRSWQKRCGFVVFQSYRRQLRVSCIEFKKARTNIPAEKIMLQLHSGEAWCKTLHKLLAAYTNESREIRLSKYVFTDCISPAPDLDANGRFLKNYPDIRHYLFSDADGLALEDLDRSCEKIIR